MEPARSVARLPWAELEVVSVEAAQRGLAWSISARRDALTRHPEATGHTTQLVIDLAAVGEFGEARSYLSRLQQIDASGRLVFSAGANLSLLSGETPYGSPEFERLIADPRNSTYTRGQLCLMAGDVARGCGYWRKPSVRRCRISRITCTCRSTTLQPKS